VPGSSEKDERTWSRTPWRRAYSTERSCSTFVPLASERSAGTRVSFRGEDHAVGVLSLEALRGADLALDPVAAEVGIRAISENSEMGKVSVVGAGMKSHPGVAAKVFSTLGDQGINIEMISTSPIKISCVVTTEAVDRAVRALHEAFDLGADQIEVEHPFGAPA